MDLQAITLSSLVYSFLINYPSIHPYIHPYIYPSIHPSVRPYVCPSIHPSIYLSILNKFGYSHFAPSFCNVPLKITKFCVFYFRSNFFSQDFNFAKFCKSRKLGIAKINDNKVNSKKSSNNSKPTIHNVISTWMYFQKVWHSLCVLTV